MPTLKKANLVEAFASFDETGAHGSEATSTNSTLSSPVRGHALWDPDL
jgi:hypothetical protein